MKNTLYQTKMNCAGNAVIIFVYIRHIIINLV